MSGEDHDANEAEGERPKLLGNPAVRASLGSWLAIAAGFAASAFDAPSWLAIAAGFAASAFDAPSWLVAGLFAVAILSGSFYVAREAVEELFREREVGIELLMTTAIAGAAALGRWREAALVAALYSITEAVEGFTIQRTRHAIRGLMDLVPPRARVLRDGAEVEIPVEELAVGERLVVRPGESMPTDGVIREGQSAIDQSAVTGESMPVERGPGDQVFAGTVNGNGALVVEATRAFRENTVNKIIELVERAQKQKALSQQFVERFARWYSPAVLVIAILLALGGALFAEDRYKALTRAAAFLVAAAPCALAVATPGTVVAAIGSAARRGVLIKGGGILEVLGRVRAVALDKTGTLTSGRPAVMGVHALGLPEVELLKLAAAVEHYSEHPLAEAIVRYAREKALSLPSATGFQAVTAAGAEATVGGRRIWVLKPTAAQERAGPLPAAATAWLEEAVGRAQTVVVVGADSNNLGLIALADRIRPEAVGLISSLHKVGVSHVVMLTGDNPATARSIASQVGIDEFHGALLPEDKVAKVQELKDRFESVAMIGDGINDAPALAAASVGVAMGTGGSDAALAAADVALIGDDLSKLEYTFRLGRRSASVIRQNIVVSMLIVVALVAGTFLADLSMFAAVVGHEGSEVLIILNGLRVALR